MITGKTISTRIDSLKRRLVKFFSMGNNTREVLQAAPYGIDSHPVKDMVAIYTETSAKDSPVVIGYINRNAVAAVGEFRTFSTDANGVVKFYIHQKNDGTCELGGDTDNMVRFSELKAAFDELKGDFNNLVTMMNAHVHPDPVSGVTGSPTTQGVASAADISGAKIVEIKTI